MLIEEAMQARAYEDSPLPIGYGQTISQPYMVARVCEVAQLRGGEAVLDVGTGSGYRQRYCRICARACLASRFVPSLPGARGAICSGCTATMWK